MGTLVSKPDIAVLETNGWQIPVNIAELQIQDDTLQTLFAKTVRSNVVDEGEGKYVMQNYALFVHTGDVLHLVVSLSCRPIVLHLAHTPP